MIVLGISAFFHDSAAALVIDGKVIAAAQEERFTRIKQDASLPVNAVDFCLRFANLTIDDVDHVVFYEKPLRKFERLLVTHLREFPFGLGQFGRAMRTWLGKRLWLKSELCQGLGCRPEQLMFSEHHLSHAASAFLCSPFSDAAIVTADGVGEWTTTAIYHGTTRDGRPDITPVQTQEFPHSIGLLYSAITAYLGFRVNEGEYKVMGLSSYGTPRFTDEFSKLASLHDDGSLTLDLSYFSYQRHATRSFTGKLEKLLGSARPPGAPLAFPATDDQTQRYADVAATLQKCTEDAMLAVAAEAHRKTGATSLCLAGGVALNCVANRTLAELGPFEQVYVQPAAGDAGGALGAALYVSSVHGDAPRTVLSSVALGESYSSDSVQSFLSDCGVAHTVFDTTESLCDAVAERMTGGEVGGWFQGRFEWGPRALGGRSIIADPRGPHIRDRVNRKVKFREPFRPFAPVVLQEEADRWFEPGQRRDQLLTPFMCSVLPATQEATELLPAVVHCDGTARVQTVDSQQNPRTWSLLRAFKARTGIGVLLNTSLNLKDEPMCASPAEAYGAFVRSDLDFLAIENCLVTKEAA